LDAAHTSTLNCDEIAGNRPRQPAYEIFTDIISCSVKTIADNNLYIHAAHRNKQWKAFCWCQRRWPWTPKIRVLVNFCDFRLRHTF